MNPGVAVRLETDTFNALKVAMQEFLPTYIEHDYGLPSEFDYSIGIGGDMPYNLFTWNFHWEHITYTDARFDLRDINFELTRTDLGESTIHMDLPVFKNWAINAL